MVRTKIICTIGPASDNITTLRKMMLAGMDVARLNFSHRDWETHRRSIELIRSLNRKYNRRIRILQDLEGYRIRVGLLWRKEGIALQRKQRVLLTNEDVFGREDLIPFDYDGSLRDIKIGSQIFIDDGNIALVVTSRRGKYLEAEVVIPGVVKERKGINIPELNFKFKGLTPKDKKDIGFGVENKVDYIAQSFVRTADDVLEVASLAKVQLPDCKIIAKIENKEGIKNIDEIIEVADGIMIARGDMGVSIPIYQIPVVQKLIIKKCKRAHKLVITATQMLESMVDNVRPTRAEVTDVANAVFDGSDFVMLSAETAVGKYPVEAVRMMNEILKFTEKFVGQLRS